MDDPDDAHRRTMTIFAILFIAAAGAFVVGIVSGAVGDVLLSLPVMAIILMAAIRDRRTLYVPPALAVMIVAILYVSLLSHTMGGGAVISAVQNILIGMVIGLAGMIVVYALLGELPGFRRERPSLVSMIVFFFGVAIYALWMMFVYLMSGLIDIDTESAMSSYMEELLWVSLGSLIIALMFFAGRSSKFFDETIVRFLKKNPAVAGMRLSGAELIRETIYGGESETVEFKSTLRTNLETGDKDKRMEHAVLKTITAFLNTGGGTLLIGVNDSGEVSGIDENSFDSRDKMNLHMTNLISAHIGNEFLPFIDFNVIDIENAAVMKVDCRPTKKPVFLKDGRTNAYFVRSGPSSVELTGMDLLNYVNHRKG